MISSCEEHTALARTLSKLAETHESLSVVHKHEADMDSQLLAEVLNEHLQLTQVSERLLVLVAVGRLQVVKELFYERVKTWQNWQNQQQALTKKREAKARYALAGNTERSRYLQTEVDEQEQRVDSMEREFLAMSNIIRSEYAHVTAERRRDMRAALIERLESLAESEQQVCAIFLLFCSSAFSAYLQILDMWQKFAPETKNIIN